MPNDPEFDRDAFARAQRNLDSSTKQRLAQTLAEYREIYDTLKPNQQKALHDWLRRAVALDVDRPKELSAVPILYVNLSDHPVAAATLERAIALWERRENYRPVTDGPDMA